MEKEEFIKRAKELGQTQEMIEDTLAEAAAWEKKYGFPYDLDGRLVVPVISDPDPIEEYGMSKKTTSL